jgi:hypothetical protein
MQILIKCGEPTSFDSLKEFFDKVEGQSVLFLDDPSMSLLNSPQLSDAATAIRHQNVSIFLTVHRLFGSSLSFRRTISSFSVFYLMLSPRLAKEISVLDSQNCLNGSLKAIFAYLLQKNEKFLILDLTHACPEIARFRIPKDNYWRVFVTD